MSQEINNSLKIIESGDGSHTILHKGLNETYHSTHGARQESAYVFIKEGLEKGIANGLKSISIFEVGFGTGLNAWLTYKKIKSTEGVNVIYHTVEPYPLDHSLYSKLNYVANEEDASVKDFFEQLHQAPWDLEVELNGNFSLKKIKSTFEEVRIEEAFFDIIYYDAFAPSKQATMWVPENIAKAFFMLKKGGLLVTYCANGQFKRDLKAVGFLVETLVGPPGKKEMTRGLK